MSLPDQCPSTIGPKAKAPARAGAVVGPAGRAAGGQAYWRGLEELADTDEFRGWLHREFPAGASELLEGSRRTFLKLMGASLALAGAATLPACRRPDHKIMPYSRNVPEETIPGQALYYATSMPLPGGGAEGLLVETHDGRPTKVEGNPLHPINRGTSSAWAQASILGLYDPDRLKDPVYTLADPGDPQAPRSWEDFRLWAKDHFAAHDADGGARLAFVADLADGPSRRAMVRRVRERWPRAAWVEYYPGGGPGGLGEAGGAGRRELLALRKARVILSLDRDFLFAEPASLLYARDFAAGRRPLGEADQMNRLYVAESRFSMTGAKSDHRVRMAPSAIPSLAVAVAQALGVREGLAARAPAAPVDADFVAAVAEDLRASPGAGLVVAGPSQPAEVHELARAINAALGNLGQTVTEVPGGSAGSGTEGLIALARRLAGGEIGTVVTLRANPVYDAPAGLGFEAAFQKAPERITLSCQASETAEASTWRLAGTHFLEEWGDTRAWDGTVAPIQPMIAPIYGGKSDLEVLAMILGDEETDGHAIVRGTWQRGLGAPSAEAFEKTWRRALHDGVIAGWPAEEPEAAGAPGARETRPARTLSAGPSPAALDVVFMVGMVGDGRFANNGWLQELPEFASRMVWDNAALVSPATADALGMVQDRATEKKKYARLADLALPGGAAVRVPVWAVPGIADNTVVLPVGYGRTVCGHVGTGVGFNTYAVKPGAESMYVGGARLTPATGEGPSRYMITTTQEHGSMEGRTAIVRRADLPAWEKFGDERARRVDPYGRELTLNFGERLGELAHTPANESIYRNPFNDTRDEPAPHAPYATGPQWGMSIDLSTCIGCNTCTVACQAENNIPIVGKAEVNKGREMHWIRVDRYFVGGLESADPESMTFQPVPCQHCENAPCETVCPVNATVHGPEGINYQVYNRCIGTRYCANNCPWKVRRFNFFDYGVKKYNGAYLGQETLGRERGPENENLIPPRFREQLDEIQKMGHNPDVTVRSRGVMEKCTFCIQRINEARIEVKLSDLGLIPDGYVKTACQQACPTDSIIFGDLLDRASRDGQGSLARQMRAHGRSYQLLGYLNSRPRTTYMVEVKNPSPAYLRALEARGDHEAGARLARWDDPFGHGGHGGHGGHEGHEGVHDGQGHPPGGEHGPGGHGEQGPAGSEPAGGHGPGHEPPPAGTPHARRGTGRRIALTILGGLA